MIGLHESGTRFSLFEDTYTSINGSMAKVAEKFEFEKAMLLRREYKEKLGLPVDKIIVGLDESVLSEDSPPGPQVRTKKLKQSLTSRNIKLDSLKSANMYSVQTPNTNLRNSTYFETSESKKTLTVVIKREKRLIKPDSISYTAKQSSNNNSKSDFM